MVRMPENTNMFQYGLCKEGRQKGKEVRHERCMNIQRLMSEVNTEEINSSAKTKRKLSD